MRVKSCVASDGGAHVIQLSDEFGCVLRPKMISRFLKARGADERASVITYAFFHAFKFPDALSVHIKCKVEICRHGCLDHCQIQSEKGDVNPDLSHYLGGPLDRKDDKVSSQEQRLPDPIEDDLASDETLYDDIIQEGEGGTSIGGNYAPVKMSLSAHQMNNKKKHQQQTLLMTKHTDMSPGDDHDNMDDDDTELDITAMSDKVWCLIITNFI